MVFKSSGPRDENMKTKVIFKDNFFFFFVFCFLIVYFFFVEMGCGVFVKVFGSLDLDLLYDLVDYVLWEFGDVNG
jgi:hypothetical protein